LLDKTSAPANLSHSAIEMCYCIVLETILPPFARMQGWPSVNCISKKKGFQKLQLAR